MCDSEYVHLIKLVNNIWFDPLVKITVKVLR